jgi:hypothetical protein
MTRDVARFFEPDYEPVRWMMNQAAPGVSWTNAEFYQAFMTNFVRVSTTNFAYETSFLQVRDAFLFPLYLGIPMAILILVTGVVTFTLPINRFLKRKESKITYSEVMEEVEAGNINVDQRKISTFDIQSDSINIKISDTKDAFDMARIQELTLQLAQEIATKMSASDHKEQALNKVNQISALANTKPDVEKLFSAFKLIKKYHHQLTHHNEQYNELTHLWSVVNVDKKRYQTNKLPFMLTMLSVLIMVFTSFYVIAYYAVGVAVDGSPTMLSNVISSPHTALDITLVILLMLLGFLAAEKMKFYKKAFGIAILVAAGINLLRIFYLPLIYLNDYLSSDGSLGIPPSVFTVAVILLVIVAALQIIAGIITIHRYNKLEKHIKSFGG